MFKQVVTISAGSAGEQDFKEKFPQLLQMFPQLDFIEKGQPVDCHYTFFIAALLFPKESFLFSLLGTFRYPSIVVE